MGKILIVCVNYNSYEDLSLYLQSINEAAKCLDVHTNKIDVYIADNSSQKKDIDLNFEYLFVKVFSLDNLGYLGGAFNVINSTQNIKNYDYVFITNVDIVFSGNLLKNLFNNTYAEDIAWIAPSIYSEYEQRDKNPQKLYRYKKRDLSLLLLMYKIPCLMHFYSNTLYKRKKYLPPLKKISSCSIYSGHGSAIILTSVFFNNIKDLHYGSFLFGEEIYLAELIRLAGLRVIYEPNLLFYDKEHTSISKLPSKTIYSYHVESLRYLLKKFY